MLHKRLAIMIFLASALVALSTVSVAQTCNDHIKITKPDNRYTNNQNGTITDKATGLMWMRCSLGQSGAQCAGSATKHTWKDALAQAQKANDDKVFGYNDWRLPSIAELRTLVESACYSPAININFFPDTPNDPYWSASPDTGNIRQAWSIYFIYSYELARVKFNNHAVRLVRGGQ